MAILDLKRFAELSPRTRKTVLCQCDRCGALKEVSKGNLYRENVNGKYVYYPSGQEPEGFVPRYDYCNSCERIVNPANKGKTIPPEVRAKISATVSAKQTGVKRSPEACAAVARAKMGSKNPQWKEDREYIEGLRKLRRKVGNAIHNSLRGRGNCLKLMGYTKEQLIAHIESQFTEGMEWGKIHIDHILPVSAFYDHGIDDLHIISHLSNLQPLFPCDNGKKFNTYDKAQFDTYMQRFAKENAAEDTIAS